MPQTSVPHVVVVGAGLAGLAAADSLLADSPRRRVTVIEPSGRVGGVLGTFAADGWLVERSADCFLAARPEGLDLVRRLGLESQLVGVTPAARRALVWHAGNAVPAPAGFRLLAPGRVAGILSTPLLSPWGRLRVLGERFVPPRRATTDESLESFATRRLGSEAFERLVQPLAAGIWTADPARLGMQAACGEFLAMEREAGSLWAGERARLRRQHGTATGARYGQFVTLATGMQTLTERLAAHIRERGGLFLAAAATSLEQVAGGGWRVLLHDGSVIDDAAGVVVAVSAAKASEVLRSGAGDLAAELAGIEYAGSCIVSLGFDRREVAHPLDAAGLVVPRIAGRRVLAVSFSSSKFPGRAPAGHVLLRVFVGGALDPAALELDDANLETLARREVADLLGARGTPRLVRIERWDHAMPQYHVGHAARVARIDAAVARLPGLGLAGAAYAGVGIPQVIASGQAAAARAISAAV